MQHGRVIYISDQSGLIDDDDGYEFQFIVEEIIGGVELEVGDYVGFLIDGEMATRVKFLRAGEFDEETEEL